MSTAIRHAVIPVPLRANRPPPCRDRAPSPPSPGALSAGTGWDFTTGWGSCNAGTLETELLSE